MRKTRMLLAAAILAVPLAGMTAQPAAACPTDACSRINCWANSPVTAIGDDLTVYFNDKPPVECGWT
jgi:hypothetical protein